jgi:protease IV
LKAGDWHAEFLGQAKNDAFSMVLASLGGGGEGTARGQGDFAAALTANQDRVMGQIAATVRTLFEVRGVQAYCMECPPAYSAAASERERVDTSRWLAAMLGFTGK